ncbi:MAG: SPOR domain-containing protein [Prevotella sp.]|jgi:hypothetical protein|nr:SPOR domain-containing protein [Prevotella sp.]
MKKGLCLFFTFCLFATYTYAQKTIVEDINTAKWGQGDVKVMQDETIQNRIAIRYDNSEDSIEDVQIRSSSPIKGGGYKIQIFMGNDQQQSKREAESKQAQIKNAYPELQTSIAFNSPFWRLRVINIATKEDAQLILTELKKQFPSFGKEMYIIPPNR